jgi:hypothetical protein
MAQPQAPNNKLKVTATALNVRDSPSLDGLIIGSISEGDIVDLLDSSEDGNWLKIQKGDLTGWSSHRYLTPYLPTSPTGPLDQIIQITASSTIAGYDWKDRGVAPLGYIKGMTLVYARVYCKLKVGDPTVLQMAKAKTGDGTKDALAWYAQEFHNLRMDNSLAGVDTLRHLFVLLIGLGMRESSGRYCEGRDRSASNTTADTAEAGLFQTSYNARSASPLLPQLYQQYSANPLGFIDIFKEGVRCRPSDLDNFGSGTGIEFQRLSKDCPAFAAEFAAVGLRTFRKHWGPINRKEVEIRPECDIMLLQIQNAVDTSSLCPAVL